MNMFARFDENPAMTLQDIKETKCYVWTDARTDGQREKNIPTTNKVCRGIITHIHILVKGDYKLVIGIIKADAVGAIIL